MNINDILLPENHLLTFKLLDWKEIATLREVCKRWNKIIDKNKYFWRILRLSGLSPQDLQSVFNQFDAKSGSTLEEVFMIINPEVVADSEFRPLIESIKKSKNTLSILAIESTDCPDEALQFNTISLLLESPKIVDFRLMTESSNRVHLSRASNLDSLRVLWLPSLWQLHETHPSLFKTLTSLQVLGVRYGHSKWRRILTHSSQSLKHLGVRMEKAEKLFPLQLPSLEVLELEVTSENGYEFPTWMLVKPTLKLTPLSLINNIPPISELWVTQATDLHFYLEQCPQVQVLRLEVTSDKTGDGAYIDDELLGFLSKRGIQVENEESVQGVKIEPLKKVIIPFQMFHSPTLLECNWLVGESVVDSASEPPWEVVV